MTSPFARAVRRRLQALRAFSLSLSTLPVLLACAIARPVRRWDWPIVLAAVAAAALIHLFGNLLNDSFDFRYGVDRRTAEDDGRPGRLLVRGELAPRDVLGLALACLALAAVPAAYLIWRRGLVVAEFGAFAVLAAYAYTGPPFVLKYRALGEAAISVAFGPALMLAAAYALTGELAWSVLPLSAAVGCATTCILVGNNLRDRDEDAHAPGVRVRTLAQFADGRLAKWLYVALPVAATALPAALAAARIAPWPLLAAPATLLLLARPFAAVLAVRRLPDIDVRTAAFTTALLLLLLAAYLLAPR